MTGTDERTLSRATHVPGEGGSARPIYLFVHIPKTGGRTLRQHFARNLKRDALRANMSAEPDQLLGSVSDERRRTCRLVMGHNVGSEVAKYFPDREHRFFTVLRDPIAHMISSYNWKAHVLAMRDGRPDSLSFEDWLSPRRTNNLQSRWLVARFADGTAPKRPLNEPEALLEETRRVLRRFWAVGRLEDLERSLLPVFDALAIPSTIAKVQNVAGRDYPKLVERGPEVEALIRERSTVDMQIYAEFAQQQKAAA
jgi:hypothetical protein